MLILVNNATMTPDVRKCLKITKFFIFFKLVRVKLLMEKGSDQELEYLKNNYRKSSYPINIYINHT